MARRALAAQVAVAVVVAGDQVVDLFAQRETPATGMQDGAALSLTSAGAHRVTSEDACSS